MCLNGVEDERFARLVLEESKSGGIDAGQYRAALAARYTGTCRRSPGVADVGAGLPPHYADVICPRVSDDIEI